MRVLLVSLVFSLVVEAAFGSVLPQGLNGRDRELAADLVASSTALRSAQLHRSLDPAEGLDLSVSFENLPLSRLPVMGTGRERAEDQNYFRLQAGTGLYRAVDLALYLTPLNPSTPMSSYGGRLRWTFYHHPRTPLFVALFAEGGNSNLNDQVLMQMLGAGAQVGFRKKQLSLSFFLSSQRTFSRFRGGAEGVTDTGEVESLDRFSLPVAVGGIYDFKKWYLGFSVDRHKETLLSAKVGKVF